MFIENMTSVELIQLRNKCNIIVPFGALEAHGPHLPLGTDSIITQAVLANLALEVQNKIVICPLIKINPTNIVRYQGTDGQMNIRLDIEIWSRYVYDILINYHDRCNPRKMLLVSWHDTLDFIAALRQVCFRVWNKTGLKVEILRLWLLAREHAVQKNIIGSEERHAAKIETSIMEFVAPSLVRKNLAINRSWIKTSYWGVDWDSFTDMGVYGNAADGNREIGYEMLNFVISETRRMIDEFFA